MLGAGFAVSAGEFRTLAGELYRWSSVVMGGGGFVTGVVVHGGAADRVYARTDVGGLFRWREAEGRWDQLLRADNLPGPGPLNVESVALDPSQVVSRGWWEMAEAA